MLFTTVTLNPCLDRREYLDQVTLGATNRSKKARVSAGGKGINVSKHLLRLIDEKGNLLKQRVNTVTLAGGKTGEIFCQLLEKELTPAEAVKGITVIPSDFETRVCIKLITPEGVTEINEEGRVGEKEIALLAEAFAEITAMGTPQVVLLCGSFPQGVDKNVENFLITLLESCGIPVIVDTSGEALVESLVGSPSLIKPNEKELEALHGAPFRKEEELVDFCRELYVDNNTEILCTLGEKGAVFVGREGVFKVKSTKVSPCDPTGAGDAFLSAFTFCRYGEGRSAKEALDFANTYVYELLKNQSNAE